MCSLLKRTLLPPNLIIKTFRKSSPQGFVIRAEGLCGFQIRSYITRGLTTCLPLSRLGIAQASLASPLAAPSVTKPREPKPLFGYLFWGGD